MPEPQASSGLSSTLRRFAFAAAWLTLPFLAGPAFAAALEPRLDSVRAVVSVGLWLVWGVTLAAALIPRTVTLTAIRIVAPAAAAAAVWAAAVTPSPTWRDALAVATTVVVAAVALAPVTGDEFVNGSAYGHERRFCLRVPGAVRLGPLPFMWAVTVAGATAGPLLLSARMWVAGAVALVVGWPVAARAAQILHGLSRRWLVFTPAGVVVHDPMVVVEAILVLRAQLGTIGPALADTTALDLTLGAPGLALQITMTEPLAISPTPARRLRGPRDGVRSEDVDAVLVAPTRPGTVLTEARARRLPVG